MAERGWIIEGWTPPPRPGPMVLEGAFVRLEPLESRHASALYMANAVDDAIWDYLPYGPFAGAGAYAKWVSGAARSEDPLFFALIDRDSGLPGGVLSYLRITPGGGSIEVGHICLAPATQRSRAATEAMYLLADWVFANGYRRFEWKCDALNAPSRRAAQRFGFSYEGVFRQATVVKGRNRDTAWFAMIDADWPCLSAGYRAWLAPENFDAAGRQATALGAFTAPCLVAADPWLAG